MEKQTKRFNICLASNELAKRGLVDVVLPGPLACATAPMVSVGRLSPSLDSFEQEEAARKAREAEKQQRMLERQRTEVKTD